MSHSCTFETFFENESCQLSRCAGCKKIKVSLGVVTLDFTQAQFLSLTASFSAARGKLATSTDAAPLTVPKQVH